jgi:pSer/pThr/pTyr-binding forkhead associated (FHA) protein
VAVLLRITGGAAPAQHQAELSEGGELQVGRQVGAGGFVVAAESVSSHHLSIRRLAGEHFLWPGETAKNGTRLNGQWAVPGRLHLLRDGDRLLLGQVELDLGLPDETAGAGEAAGGTAELALRMVRDLLAAPAGAAQPTDDDPRRPALIVVSGRHSGRRHPLTAHPQGLVIGRGQHCAVMLDDRDTSREHARLRFDARGLTIEDLGSRHGVLVNDERVRGERRLVDRDQLQLGNVRLVLAHPGQPAPRPTQASAPPVVSAVSITAEPPPEPEAPARAPAPEAPAPAPPAEAAPAPAEVGLTAEPAPTPAPPADPVPPAEPEPATALPSPAANPAPQPVPPAAPARPAGGFPIWAALLALVVLAGTITLLVLILRT